MAVWTVAILVVGGMLAVLVSWILVCIDGCVWPFDGAWQQRRQVVAMIEAGEFRCPVGHAVFHLPPR